LSQGERRLGAIMFTDVVGFTSMSARDEARALDLLEKYRSMLESVFPKYGGRVVKTMGDGFLVEFASAVEAVNCAVAVQKGMKEFNALLPEGEKVMVRVGIHVGDVVHSGSDVLGDAVNVASRVQPLAEGGGICVTRQVADQVEGKVKWQLVSIGIKELRNVPNPVEIFAVGVEGAEPAVAAAQPHPERRIAILPFSNLSPDPNDRYFADGITEELISTVSKIGEVSVISRASAMRYRDTSLPIRQVGRELGVGAILEGSVRKAGNRVRISAQMIEVEADRYVWSQSYDRDLTDVLGVQGEIAEKVAEGLRVRLLSREKKELQARPTESPEAYNLYLKGRFHWNERTEEGVERAVRYFEEALKADPQFAKAYTGLADCYLILADYGWMVPSKAGELARQNSMKALSIDESLAEAHASLGLVNVNHTWDFWEGEKELKMAMELNPNYAPAFHWYSVLLNFQGRHEESLDFIRRALAVDPFSLVVRQSLGVTLMMLGRHKEALELFSKVESENPRLPSVHYWKSVLGTELSNQQLAMEEARKEVECDNFDPSAKLDLAFACSEAGEKAEATKILDEVLKVRDAYVSPCSLGLVMLSLGRQAEGARWLGRALEEHDSALLYFVSVPAYRRCLSTPEGREVGRRIGIRSGPS
jgi:adenylate cyclase